MGVAPIHDVGGRHPLGQGPDAAFGLRGHASVHNPLGDQLAGFREGQLANQGAWIIAVPEDTGGVGEQDQLHRLEGGRQFAGHGVSIDVVGLPLGIGGNTGDHWNVPLAEQGGQHARVHRFHLTHQAIGPLLPGAGPHQLAVAAGKPHCPASHLVQTVHDLFVDPPHQHHLDHIHGFGIGDAQAFAEAGLDRQPLEPLVDLGSPAVDHHRLDAHAGQQGEVTEHGLPQVLPHHGGAAVLHHHPFPGEALDIGKGLTQDGHPQGVFGTDVEIGAQGWKRGKELGIGTGSLIRGNAAFGWSGRWLRPDGRTGPPPASLGHEPGLASPGGGQMLGSHHLQPSSPAALSITSTWPGAG